VQYERVDDALVFSRSVGTYRFSFKAERIRQERTGVHARVAVGLNGVDLAWGYFNIDRDEDRVRFSNSAYKMIAPDYRRNGLLDYPTDYLRKDLNDFCAGLWVAQVEQFMPDVMEGAEEREGPAFLLEPFILDGGGTIIFGPPGRGKSYAMLMLAVALDAGLEKHHAPWPVTEPKRVLIINLERSARSLAQRIGNVNRCLRLDAKRPLHVLNARGRSLEDVMPAVTRYVAKHAIDVVFLDSLSRAGLGDMNANDSVNKIVDRLNSLPTWVALGHTPRADTTHVYGSQMFDAAADLTVRLQSQQEDDGPLGIGLELDKRNDIAWHKMEIIALEFDDLGLAKMRPARDGEFPDVEAGRKMTMRQQIMQFLQDCDDGAADASTVAEATGFNRSNVSSLFTKDTDHFVFVRKDGRKALYGVRQPPRLDVKS
jgi:hypothetical protein